MALSLVHRLLASAMLFVVAVGGGGMPTLDALVYHGPSRLVGSLRTHYEASSSCHGDGCSIRSDVSPRVLGDLPPQAPAVVPVKQVEPTLVGKTVPSRTISLQYLSRAPPSA